MIAVASAVWLVLFGVMAAQHEASVVHVRDLAGGYAHGRALVGHHENTHSDIHGQRSSDSDAGECALLTAFHQAASARVIAPSVVITACATRLYTVAVEADAVASAAVYRLAPKTSPPVA